MSGAFDRVIRLHAAQGDDAIVCAMNMDRRNIRLSWAFPAQQGLNAPSHESRVRVEEHLIKEPCLLRIHNAKETARYRNSPFRRRDNKGGGNVR